jgi:benzoylformate decarboxylase
VIHSHVDPEEIGRIYGVDVALVGDERLVLADLLDHLRRAAGPPPRTRAAHLARAREALAAALSPDTDGRSGTPGRLRVADVVGVVVEQAAGATVVSDVTTSTPPLLRALPQTSPLDYFATCSGSLGWGTGAALGVALGLPGRRVLSVLGDGVFQFGIQALWSAARARLPVTFVVVNNESYAAVASALHRHGGQAARTGVYPGKDISGPRIDRISEGFGVPAVRVEDAAGLREALRSARERPGPFLVEVMTDPTDLGAPAA